MEGLRWGGGGGEMIEEGGGNVWWGRDGMHGNGCMVMIHRMKA